MKFLRLVALFFSFFAAAGAVVAAPDEEALGRSAGYPAGRSMAQAYQEPYIVGSFSAMDSFNPSCALAPATAPWPLKTAATEPPIRYRFDGRTLTLDDYMQRQRATGLLVVKDGEIVAERYNYQRTADMRMVSHSMAKTITALGVLKAVEDGLIRSLDDRAEAYAPELEGTLYGQTRIVHLMRMASGARFVEDYSAHDDRRAFNDAARRLGIAHAVRLVTERAEPEGQRFNYAGAQTQVLGLVLRGATGRTMCDYVGETVWQAIGAEAQATWLINPVDQVELAQGGFNATLRDYARLGLMLANDGQGPHAAVLSREHVLAMTDAQQQPEAFRPGHMQYHGSTYYGYGLQTWILPGSHRRFALQGIHGQAIFVDPALKLVVVHTAVGKDASGDASGAHLGAERDALLRGIVARYGNW
ncbi:serine hydrolase [Rhizobacter sp. Root1221]|uniref:serine hydrolase domain-containing protein n=1 Tax=Rhizobacter sp. Root1221 TaxID=1736433 RepID=UPI00070053C4|nr:serine hydrolase domain-containing protein [Rhizobacter sp. Root1221]KQV78828.1 serine hydrolase [Rhizobacter sp. Root1221]